MAPLKPETLDLLRVKLRDLPKEQREFFVKVVDDFFDMHYAPGPHRPFVEDYERRARGGRNVEFWLSDAVIFFAKIAGEGIVQNLAWTVVKDIANRIWMTQAGKGAQNSKFEAVVKVESYRKQRRLWHPGTTPGRRIPDGFEQTVQKQLEFTFKVRKRK